MAKYDNYDAPPQDIVQRVIRGFIIYNSDKIIRPLADLTDLNATIEPLVQNVSSGLHSIISAASLPYELTCDTLQQRRFDAFLSSERIRGLGDVEPGASLSEQQERAASERASVKMDEFMNSADGQAFLVNGVVHDLDRRLRSPRIGAAAEEILIQALVSTWSLFEVFASSFITSWINEHPSSSKLVLSSPDLKSFFGKQVVDLDVIGDHGFDLSTSMGSIIFRGKKLDSLQVVRGAFEALFSNADIRAALGDDLWVLNQRRHLFVHKRGVIDKDFLDRTGSNLPIGEKMNLVSDDIVNHIFTVRDAVIAICNALKKL